MVEDEQRLPLDKVTQLQEQIDALALGMFDTIRKVPEMVNDTEALSSLSAHLLATCGSINILIDDLPGITSSEEEQLQELSRLNKINEEKGQLLLKVHAQAMAYRKECTESVSIIAKDKLSQCIPISNPTSAS